MAKFVTQLKQLSEHCQFGDTVNDMLHDQIVCLLAESDLTLAR